MSMPTLCECGELIDFDDMRAISNELYCVEYYENLEGEE